MNLGTADGHPTKIEGVIYLKTGKTLGLTIARSFLIRADEVIQSGELPYPLGLFSRSAVLASTDYYRNGLFGAKDRFAQLWSRGTGTNVVRTVRSDWAEMLGWSRDLLLLCL